MGKSMVNDLKITFYSLQEDSYGNINNTILFKNEHYEKVKSYKKLALDDNANLVDIKTKKVILKRFNAI